MKSLISFLFALVFLASCRSPQYFVQKGDYDKAIDLYSSNLRYQEKDKKKEKDVNGLEFAFANAQSRDSAQLFFLNEAGLAENWPRIHTLHRQIQTRQQKVSALTPLQARNGYSPRFTRIEAIDSLEADSRLKAAAFIYDRAQALLAITESTGQRQPARDAFYSLKDLKANYFPYWENTNALIDSAYKAGKAHILLDLSTVDGVYDGATFWEYTDLKANFIKNDWLAFYADPAARAEFDYRAKCRLVSLDVGSESTYSSERTETKQVEDGYDEKLDSAGHVISRTVKYRTETKTITTYYSSRSAYATVLLELIDEHSGEMITSQALQGSYNFDENSEIFAPSAPTYWGMIGRVAGGVESDLRSCLRRFLVER